MFYTEINCPTNAPPAVVPLDFIFHGHFNLLTLRSSPLLPNRHSIMSITSIRFGRQLAVSGEHISQNSDHKTLKHIYFPVEIICLLLVISSKTWCVSVAPDRRGLCGVRPPVSSWLCSLNRKPLLDAITRLQVMWCEPQTLLVL